METFFSQHTKKLDIDASTRSLLWEQSLVAVHYPEVQGELLNEDNESCDPAHYVGRAAQIMRTLEKLSKDGGYVCAKYYVPGSYPSEKWSVGKIEQQEICKIEGKWESSPDRTAILKTLSLSKPKVIHPRDHAVILVGCPRQWTLVRWGKAGSVIESIVENREREVVLNLDCLSPDQQEILCSEYMRLPEAEADGLPRLTSLLLPTGRTMKDIDILGLAVGGKTIFAQVTRSTFEEARTKLERLSKYRDEENGHVVLFCDCDEPTINDGIVVYPIQNVFQSFVSSIDGKNKIQRMIQPLS